MTPRGASYRAWLAALILLTLLAPAAAFGHSQIDGVGAKKLLARLDAAQTAAPAQPGALLRLAAEVQRVIDIANGDLRHHGPRLSPAGRYLLEQLARRGIEVEHSPSLGRYRRYLKPYIDYLSRAPLTAQAEQAELELLYGRFIDSYRDDPLRPLTPDRHRLRQRLAEVQDFLDRVARPELRRRALLLLIGYQTRAALSGSTPAARTAYLHQARANLTRLTDKPRPGVRDDRLADLARDWVERAAAAAAAH